MKIVFMVAEKPSLAQSISSILSSKTKMTSRKGSNGSCSVHEWHEYFEMGKCDAMFRMTSVCGHVNAVDFPAKYNNWTLVEPEVLFECPIVKKEATPALRMPSFLAHEAKNADFVVLWLDCDKEGEHICFEVLDCIQHVIKRKNESSIYRAKFSSITEKDIRSAMASLTTPNKNIADSVEARQELDLRIGCAFTRFQTRFFHEKYGDLDSSLISYGPCQTPTLGFCVDRHDAIQTFSPEPYWLLDVVVETKCGTSLKLNWEKGPLFDVDVAQVFYSLIKSENIARVESVSTKEKQKERPLALNTVELMKVASSKLSMSPITAMQIAERLYIQGYISYPRTESTHYHENFDFKEVLQAQAHNENWGPYVKNLLVKGLNKPKKGHDAGDHPPITPMRSVSENSLERDQWRLYDYIVRHFIATLSTNCKYLVTTIEISIGDEKFTIIGKKLTELGFTAILGSQALSPDEIIPSSIQKGSLLSIKDKKLSKYATTPPDYLTESDLITLMEKHGIGTDASIPAHISNIVQRGYASLQSNRKLVPSPLGIVLVHGYQRIDAELVIPKMRSAVEEQLQLIACGKADYASVLKHALERFELKFFYFKNNIEEMDSLFEVTFSTLAESGRPFSKCGRCYRFMKYIQARPSRLYCPHCDETYSVPQNVNIKLYQESVCPLDSFQLIYYTGGVKGKSGIFCPYCYNHPPFDDMDKKKGSCNNCSHPTCLYGKNANGVSSCGECENGVLVLDIASGPKWKLGCTSCDVIVRLFEEALKVSVLHESSCSSCEAQLLRVEYKDSKSKLKEGQTSAEGCMYCHKELSQLVVKHKAVFLKQRKASGRGGRGGRGGRSLTKKPPKDKMSQLAAYFV